MHPKHPRVYGPLSLGPYMKTLPNRFIMGYMYTRLEGHYIPGLLLPLLRSSTDDDDDHHYRTDLGRLASYFSERSRGGAGLMVTGGISPNREGWLILFASKLTT